MKSSLPNTNIVYDGSRKDEMQEFLDFLYTIRTQNPNLNFNSDIVYSQLRDRGLQKAERNEYGVGKNVGQFFDRWAKNFKGRDVRAFCDTYGWPYWFQFVNNVYDQREYIKLYIPINMPHLYEGVNQLFDFMDREGIEHQSKVGKTMRVDNVIVRLRKGDVASANKIIDFIDSNPYLRTGLNKPNPFIPTVKGVGYMDEHGNSYNSDISDFISEYINDCFEKGKSRVSLEEFRDYIKRYCLDRSLVETFEIAYNGRVQGKKEDKKQELTVDQKTGLLMDCIKATYEKYGYAQVEYALISAVTSHNYNYFTNGRTTLELREKLKENIDSEELNVIIRSCLDRLVPQRMISKNNIENIKLYCRTILANRMTFSLDEACMVTLDKYNREQLVFALYSFVNNGDASRFSRFYGESRVNYRDVIISIGQENIMDLISSSLKAKGYDVVGLKKDELIEYYVTMLEQTNYYDFGDRPKMM